MGMRSWMDQTEFTRLQTAVQYAVDDATRARHDLPPTHWRWLQSAWAYGRVTKRRRRQQGRQKYWSVACPTTGCVAGTIVIQNGDNLVVPQEVSEDAEVM